MALSLLRFQTTFQSAWKPLLLLTVIDLIFISLHLGNTFLPVEYNPMLNIEKEAGFSEIFQYMKYLAGVVLLCVIAGKSGTPHFLAWAMLFLYLLADDALGFHETLGGLAAAEMAFAMPLGLRHQDLGELLAAAFSALALCGPLGLAYLRGSDSFKRSSHHLLLMLALLGCFGVLVDFVHMMVQSGWKLKFMLALLEDGGEMLVSSSLVAYLLFLKKCNGQPPKFSFQK